MPTFPAIPQPEVVRYERPLLESEVSQLLEYLRFESRSWSGHREYALVGTVALAGLYREECLDLLVEHVDLARRMIWVKRREWLKDTRRPKLFPNVPITDELATILAAWLPRTHSEYAFPSGKTGGKWTRATTGNDSVNVLTAAARAAGLTSDVTFTRLRHFYNSRSRSPVPACRDVRAILIGGPADPVIIGDENIGVLTAIRYRTLKALWNAGDGGLTGKELKEKAGAEGAVNAWSDMRNLYPALKERLPSPGKGYPGSDARYRLIR
jgi:integrase